MKIHMDYLEGKVEEYDNVKVQWEHERKTHARKIQTMEDRAKERALEVEKEVAKVREEWESKMAEAERRARIEI